MKTENILKRMAAVLLVLVLCITVTDMAPFAKTKAKPRLSDTSLIMETNQDGIISLRKAYSKVTWRSSDKSVVKIEKTFGKYRQNVSLETRNKTGTCTIKAKMKNKTYSCKVTVKKGDIIKNYSGKKSKTVLEDVVQTEQSVTVRYKMCAAAYNKKKSTPASYGHAILLEKYENGKWNNVPMNGDFMCWDCAMYIIPPKTSISKTVHLENYFDISLLAKGSYRLNVNVFYPDAKAPYVKFKLK